MSNNALLFQRFDSPYLKLQNRVVMAPMTRNRAHADGTASEMMAEYYVARSSAGLVITEGVQPSAIGQGYPRTPGIYAPPHIAAWMSMNQRVHSDGAKSFLQIMHAGRVSHPLNNSGHQPIAPSAIAVSDGAKMYTDTQGMVSFPVPRTMSIEDIRGAQEEHVNAARNAITAGFDGVELHGTSGYLIAQFLSTNTNNRGDHYGGSLQNRIRFAVETLESMIDAIGAYRVGFRVSPGFTHNDLRDENPLETHRVLLVAIANLPLAYLHVMRAPNGFPDAPSYDPLTELRAHFRGIVIATGNFSAITAEATLQSGAADLIGFGRPFIANPDLVSRMQNGYPLAEPDPATFYTPGARGYIDYSAFDV
jgi:N-ethylmaleimide reductase